MIFECIANILLKVKVEAGVVTVYAVVLPLVKAIDSRMNKGLLLCKLYDYVLTANEELHFTHCQVKYTTVLIHR